MGDSIYYFRLKIPSVSQEEYTIKHLKEIAPKKVQIF